MINNTKLTEAGQQYATAYDAHYTTKDIYKAFKLYGRIIAMLKGLSSALTLQKSTPLNQPPFSTLPSSPILIKAI
jgi:hypothetical protein